MHLCQAIDCWKGMKGDMMPSAFPAQGAQDRAILVGDHKQLGPVVTEHNLCRAYLSMLERPMLSFVSAYSIYTTGFPLSGMRKAESVRLCCPLFALPSVA